MTDPRPDPRRSLGAAGEDLIAGWYERAGYRVLARNWRCRAGELDLVVAGAGIVVFCEVKTRRGRAFGAPFEAVTVAKQRRLRGLAVQWLDEHRPRGAHRIRFDVASVHAVPGEQPQVELLEDAF